MNWIITFYSALLFFVLVPGVLVSFPPKRSKYVVAGFHALVFALIWAFTHKMVWHAYIALTHHEGFSEGAATKEDQLKVAQQLAPNIDASYAKQQSAIAAQLARTQPGSPLYKKLQTESQAVAKALDAAKKAKAASESKKNKN